MPGDHPDAMLDRAPAAIVAIDEGGRVTYWNHAAQSMFGYTREQATGRGIADLIIPQRYRAAHREALAQTVAGEARVLDRRLEAEALRADGSELPVIISLQGVRDAGQWTFHAFVIDATAQRTGERQHAQVVDALRRELHERERRFETIVGALADPVTIRDRNHRFVYGNQAAVSYLGFDSWEQMRDSTPDQVMSDYLVFDEDGRPLTMADIPSVRILRGEPAEPLTLQTVHRATGTRRWDLLKSAPLINADGEVEATIMIIEDITDRKRAERQLAFLADAGDLLASSLDYEQTLRNVAQLAVPQIADWCGVDLFDERGGRIPVAVAHVDPAKLALAEELRGYEPERLNPEMGIGRVWATGEPELYPVIGEEMLRAGAVDEHHLELLHEIGFSSAIIVPIRLGDRTLGAMTLVSAESGRALDEYDLRLAEQVSDRAAVAIENSRLYSERSLVAHTLQQSLLPEGLPDIPGYDLAALYVPAVAGTEVGGDFYDAWEVDGGWMIAVGDVTGKGVKAAALTSLVRYTLRTASDFGCSPAQLLGHVDRALKKQRELSLCTALCLRLSRDEAVLAVGGHPLPLHIADGGAHAVGVSGPLLGGFQDAEWSDRPVHLAPGETLLAYTDGVTDAVGEGGSRFGFSRMRAALQTCSDRSAATVVEALRLELDAFQSGAHADDTAVLGVHRQADPPGG